MIKQLKNMSSLKYTLGKSMVYKIIIGDKLKKKNYSERRSRQSYSLTQLNKTSDLFTMTSVTFVTH